MCVLFPVQCPAGPSLAWDMSGAVWAAPTMQAAVRQPLSLVVSVGVAPNKLLLLLLLLLPSGCRSKLGLGHVWCCVGGRGPTCISAVNPRPSCVSGCGP
jgi:hypothetical protein